MKFFLLIIFFLFLKVTFIEAQVAVLPFEDISNDINGIDLETSHIIAFKLKNKGIKVVFPEEILDFLARDRIRWTGWLDKVTAIKIYRTYGANMILIGTVTEKDKEKGSFGITVRLIRSQDYQLIWSKTEGLSIEEKISLLNIKKFDFKKIQNEVIDSIVDELIIVINKAKNFPPEVEIEDIFLRPRFVKTDTLIECAIKLNLSGDKPDDIYILLPWGKKIPLIEDRSRNLYIGVWKAPNREGRYPINITFNWKSPWNTKKKFFLSSFIVDNTAPKFTLKIRHGEKIGKVIAFRRYITIVPVFENSEPISRWQMIITGKNKKEILNIEQPGKLPESFNWRGTDANGHKLPKGIYNLKLTVWDKAGNSSFATADLLVVKDPPNIKIKANNRGKEIEIILEINDHPVPISNWYLEIWDNKGNLIKEITGEKFTKQKIKIPYYEHLYYSVEFRDILGNIFRIRNRKLAAIIMKSDKDKKIKEKKWLDDF